MWNIILYFVVVAEAGRILAYHADVQLGGSVTLPCQDSNHIDVPAGLLDIQWWTGEHLVTRYQNDIITRGSRYINRTDLSTDAFGKGDFSLSITHTEYSDSGQYQCVLIKDGQKVILGEVDLEVKVRRPQSALFIKSGQGVILSCFGRVDWSGSEAAFVQWKRWAQVVIQWKSGSLFVDPMFYGRVSVVKDRIRHGDISLIFNETRSDDQGLYMCFFKKNNDIRPAIIVNLTVTEHMSRVIANSGSQIQLPLPNESSVTLSFLPDGGNFTISICEIEQHLLTCASNYNYRMMLHENTLILSNITPADSGTFIVKDKDTSRTKSVFMVQIQIVKIGTMIVTFSEFFIPLVAAVVVIGCLLVTLAAFFFSYRHKIQKLRKPVETKSDEETEMEPLQTTKVRTQEDTHSCNKSAVIELEEL